MYRVMNIAICGTIVFNIAICVLYCLMSRVPDAFTGARAGAVPAEAKLRMAQPELS